MSFLLNHFDRERRKQFNSLFYFPAVNIGPRSGGGKKASYGSGKQTLRLKSNGTAAVEEVDSVRTTAEENINLALENFMGINDAELGNSALMVKSFK